MLRGSRLDAPGVLHHVMARGIEHQRIFQNDAGREDFVQRLARLAEAEALTVYASPLYTSKKHWRRGAFLWRRENRATVDTLARWI
jgi:hypothetical protein